MNVVSREDVLNHKYRGTKTTRLRSTGAGRFVRSETDKMARDSTNVLEEKRITSHDINIAKESTLPQQEKDWGHRALVIYNHNNNPLTLHSLSIPMQLYIVFVFSGRTHPMFRHI